MKYTLLIFTFLLLSSNFCNAQSKRTPTVIPDGGGMTAEELKSHNARLKMEDKKQKLRSQAAKTASNEKIAKWKSDQKKATEEAIKEDAKNTIHLTGSDDEGDAVKSNYYYYYPTKSQAQLQAEENSRRTNNAMKNVDDLLNKIGTANKEKIDDRNTKEARERALAAKAKVQKRNDYYNEAYRLLRLEGAGSFSNGLATAHSDGGYIYINKNGQKAIKGKFDHARDFYNGFAVVGMGGKYDYKNGVINTSGDLVIPIKYDAIGNFHNDIAIVEYKDKWGALNKSGAVVIPIKYDVMNDFSKGLALVGIIDELRPSSFGKPYYKWGVVDKYGNTVIPMKYNKLSSFSEGLILANLNGKYGYINKKNEVIIPFIYTKAVDFLNGKAKIEISGKTYFIDNLGRPIEPTVYNEVKEYSEGLAQVRMGYENQGDYTTWGYINKLKEEVIPLKYQFAGPFSDGLAAVKFNDKWGAIDREGNIVIPFKYDGIGGNLSNFKNGMVIVRIGGFGGKYGLIDKKSNIIIPITYGSISYFSEGLAVASLTLNGKKGFIDINNRVIIPFKYDIAWSFKNGIAKVRVKDGDWHHNEFYINKNGTCVRGCD